MKWFRGLMTRLWKDDSGQGMVEYGLILALVAVVVIGLLLTMGGELERFFQYIVDKMGEITTPTT
ncbi:Flp family type IVb pilin [Paenibacillus sp.]|uniref:Flp family type IVb pilin n=1 Tax=Paenibacillus sp. TaxID=58172 RepID=UPI002D587CD7|nr:Flp family type IVb pilin [Paenibacillus sp.]HZG58198.1 Flp family type IVb pilin [Paenibacillus sp.]